MKTLGVKFQVAGVKEAQASLNSLKTSLNQSLQQNKQAVNNAISLNGRLKFRKNKPVTQTDSRVTSENIVRLDQTTISELGKIMVGDGNRSLDPLGNIRRRGLIGGSFANLGSSLRSIYKGFLESIGSGLGTDFGEGLKKALEEDLDISFKRRGEVTGKTIAFFNP